MSDSYTLPDMCLKSFVAGEREEAERLLEQVEEPQLLKDEEKGGTLLHWAARWGWYETVKELIKHYHLNVVARSFDGSVPLIHACFNGCLKTIQYLIAQDKCDPMCKRNDGWTPLHFACAGGNVHIVKYLITQCRCDPMCKANSGITPLHSVCRNSGNLDVLSYLVNECNCDPMIQSNDGWTPLHLACAGGYVNAVKYLITQCRCDPMCRRNDGWTPLHFACAGSNVNIVKYLITQCRCDPMCKANSGITPLHSVCCNSGNLDVLSYLVNECNCDPMIQSNDGWTPLHFACAGGNINIVKYLITQCRCDPMCKANDDITPLHSVSRDSGNLDVICYLVNECNCDPMCQSNDGWTPLHFACAEGNFSVVKYLITQCRCDPMCKANDGITPLHSVCHNSGNLDVLGYLVTECKCDPMCQSSDGWTPLHFACAGGNVNAVKYLITQCRCDPIFKANGSITPLHSVCRNSGNLDVLSHLVNECNCDSMCQSSDGWTPLHFACAGGNVNVVKYLITQCRCDPLCKANDGITPLHSVCRNSGNLEVTRYLIEECKCDPMCRTNFFQTPLHLACYSGHYAVAEYLLCTGDVNPASINIFLMSLFNFAIEKNELKVLLTKFSYYNSCLKIESYINMFLLGDSGVGKSTLTEVIKQRSQGGVWFGQYRSISGVEPLTAGIISHRLEHKELGNIILHDLAGQPEYYSSHIAVLENTLQGSAAVFIVVVKLSEDAPYRWLSIVKDLSSKCSSTCYVLTVASHKDTVHQSLREQFRHKLEEKISSFLKGKRLRSMGTVYLDCRKLDSRNFTVFKSSLSTTCQSVRSTLSHKKILSCNKIYCQMLYLLMNIKRQSVYTTDTLWKMVRESNHEYYLPENEEKLLLSLYHLHCIGLIMFINTPGGSWVVFQKQTLLAEINGKIFAPSTFKTFRHMISNTG